MKWNGIQAVNLLCEMTLSALCRVWKNPKAGVYDNVFDDLDTTPVHPYHYTEVNCQPAS